MKKTIVIIALLFLVIWGVYDITNKESNSYSDAQKEQMAAEPDFIVGLNSGNAAPDFTLSTPEGKDIKLSDLQGKKVILNMWASWCPPCIDEMPYLQAYYDDHQAEGVEVIAVNLTQAENNEDDVMRFIKDFELSFPVVLDRESRVANMYQVRTIPTTFILDSDGKVEQKIIGPLTYEMIDELMEQVK
ncbi:redoxin domain-containing protein [Paenibacillus paeoniae]|uniref:TlpA family protein disulfide reductase n=1 Tax=Paenibacillus paeoniae TaxID=2292705 RepID=A0A371PL28_9BACL|nr:redoxin domain-containing protein [Paenibacillus paeoniae]REK76898.1 TlpA family protein disulfide reductase [Paenibacillus paeoniae]